MLHLWAQFAIVLTLTGIFCEEPQCSKFHYEAQTLEKMIRTEIKVEAMEKEILKINQLVLESLQALKTERGDLAKDFTVIQKNLLDENDKLKKDYEDLERGVLEKNEELVKNNEDLKENLTTSFSAIKDKLMTPSVVFKARTLSSASASTGQTLIFTTTMMNDGGAYDNATGIFTVPVAVTYLFTAHLCLNGAKYFYYGIMADNVVQTSGAYSHSRAYSCHTTDAIFVLQPGQKVAIKCLSGESNMFYETNHTPPTYNLWNTFSGVLINK